jgi:DNA-binding transcriptional LysR family regulator
VNIRQLTYFLAVAQELNFTRAAERVGIAQPPLSQQIIALEQELGTDLFTRHNRRVQLTIAGEILVEHAHRVINAANAAIDAVRLVERGARSSIVVGAVYSAIYSSLPDTLRIFAALAPRTEVSLQEMTVAQQVTGLKEGQIEVGLLRGPVFDRDLTTEVLYREHLVIAAPEGGPLKAGEPVSLKDLADTPVIITGRSNHRGYGDRVMDVFDTYDVQPTVAHEVSDMHTAVCLVAAGLGVSIVPAIMQTMRTRGVIYCPIAEKTPGVSFSLAWRKGSESPLIDLFFDAARQSAAALQEAHPALFMPK